MGKALRKAKVYFLVCLFLPVYGFSALTEGDPAAEVSPVGVSSTLDAGSSASGSAGAGGLKRLLRRTSRLNVAGLFQSNLSHSVIGYTNPI